MGPLAFQFTAWLLESCNFLRALVEITKHRKKLKVFLKNCENTCYENNESEIFLQKNKNISIQAPEMFLVKKVL